MTMSTHKLSRRTFLRGVGVTMALPWMESLTVWGDEPAAAPPASEAPVRLAVLFSGNGFHSKEWWAKGEGKDMELGQVLSPLADFREKLQQFPLRRRNLDRRQASLGAGKQRRIQRRVGRDQRIADETVNGCPLFFVHLDFPSRHFQFHLPPAAQGQRCVEAN